jgi:pantetheine-phosphate adenylyltransferase
MAKRRTRRAVYAGSFDPVTNGHLYMIRAGAQLFDELVVCIGANPDKTYTFTVDERVAMLKAVSAGLKNVRVDAMPHVFLVDRAEAVGAEWILRGLRDEEDFRCERTMRQVNADIRPEISTVFLMPPRELSEISSSFVKGLVGPSGWERVVQKYLPAEVVSIIRGRLPGGG